MQLTHQPPDQDRVLRTFRHGPLGHLIALTLFGAGIHFGLPYVTRGLASLPLYAWIVAGPIALITAPLLLMVLWACTDAFFSSLSRSNWLCKLTSDGLCLNLRSYLNAHFDGDEPTVLELSYREISSAAKTRERFERRSSDGDTVHYQSFLELVLEGVDLEPIRAAVRAERQREGPERSYLGVGVRTKHRHVPVFVSESGRLRVEWKRGMLRALAGHVRLVDGTSVDLSAGDPEESFEA